MGVPAPARPANRNNPAMRLSFTFRRAGRHNAALGTDPADGPPTEYQRQKWRSAEWGGRGAATEEFEGFGFMARREIQPGQRYRQTDSTSIWEVLNLKADAEGVSHARLVRVGDATAAKTISVDALKDPRLYKLVQD